MTDTQRTLLGQTQLLWLQGKLLQSSAKWQLLGQQILMGRMMLPAAIATQQLSIPQFAELAALAQLAARAQAGDPTLTQAELTYLAANQAKLTPEVLALLQLPSIPYNLDAWDGYAYEREVVLATARASGKNLVVIAGDTTMPGPMISRTKMATWLGLSLPPVRFPPLGLSITSTCLQSRSRRQRRPL